MPQNMRVVEGAEGVEPDFRRSPSDLEGVPEGHAAVALGPLEPVVGDVNRVQPDIGGVSHTELESDGSAASSAQPVRGFRWRLLRSMLERRRLEERELRAIEYLLMHAMTARPAPGELRQLRSEEEVDILLSSLHTVDQGEGTEKAIREYMELAEEVLSVSSMAEFNEHQLAERARAIKYRLGSSYRQREVLKASILCLNMLERVALDEGFARKPEELKCWKLGRLPKEWLKGEEAGPSSAESQAAEGDSEGESPDEAAAWYDSESAVTERYDKTSMERLGIPASALGRLGLAGLGREREAAGRPVDLVNLPFAADTSGCRASQGAVASEQRGADAEQGAVAEAVTPEPVGSAHASAPSSNGTSSASDNVSAAESGGAGDLEPGKSSLRKEFGEEVWNSLPPPRSSSRSDIGQVEISTEQRKALVSKARKMVRSGKKGRRAELPAPVPSGRRRLAYVLLGVSLSVSFCMSLLMWLEPRAEFIEDPGQYQAYALPANAGIPLEQARRVDDVLIMTASNGWARLSRSSRRGLALHLKDNLLGRDSIHQILVVDPSGNPLARIRNHEVHVGEVVR